MESGETELRAAQRGQDRASHRGKARVEQRTPKRSEARPEARIKKGQAEATFGQGQGGRAESAALNS